MKNPGWGSREGLVRGCRRGLWILMGLLLPVGGGTFGLHAQNSPHGRISLECEDCHTPASWSSLASPMRFSHASTDFPLIGQHSLVSCRQCHSSLVFGSTSSACADCHDDIHRGELGTLCERCHTPTSWLIPDMRQRHTRTPFALEGVHQTTPCEGCHLRQEKYEYVNIPTDCFSCHRAAFAATTAPSHTAAGFGTACEQCHDMRAARWGGSFDHRATAFPLTGAHLRQPCVACHTGSQFRGAPTGCLQCHQNAYDQTSNPNHRTAGFPTDCVSCHSTERWQPATFDHTSFFPISQGSKHPPGRWNACTDCHAVPTSFAQFTCFTCHEHAQPSMDQKHTGVPGYRYNSPDCLRCHPQGRGG